MLFLIFTPTCTFVLRDGGDTKSLFLHREDGGCGCVIYDSAWPLMPTHTQEYKYWFAAKI